MRTIILSIILALSYARPQQEEQNSEAVPDYSNYYYENYDTNVGDSDYETVNSGKICNYFVHYSVPNVENNFLFQNQTFHIFSRIL